MKASEAKALSDSVCSNGLMKTMDLIVAHIKEAIGKGYRSVGVCNLIPTQHRRTAVAQLKEWGYSVDEGYDPRDATSWITVSW